MIRKPNGSDAKRLGTGVLVAGMAAAGAVALASPAAAAGTLNSLSITPASRTADLTHCAKYVLTGKNTDGTNGTGTVTIQTSGDNDTGTGNTTSGVCTGPTGTPNAATGTRNRNSQVTLDSNGQAVFYVGATQAGTVSIEADNGATGDNASPGAVSSNTATLNAVNNANNGVSTLKVAPSSLNVTAGSPATFRLTALDSAGQPVQNAVISRNNATNATVTTDVNGQANYTVPGTETNTGSTQTFYVNQTSNASSTGGPDSGEPQVQATITVVASKPADSLTLSCPDQAADDSGANTCTVPSDGTATINALVTNNGQPVSGAVVNFTNNGGQISAATATTNDNGIASVTLTATNPSATANETDTVDASVDTSNNGTVDADNAETVQFEHRTATALVITPGNDTVATGSTITENAQVDDQFGDLYTSSPDSVTFTVSGRNATNGTVNTRSTGKASFSYTDNAPATSSTMQDTVTITDSLNLTTTDDPNGSIDAGNQEPYTITYVSGGTTVSNVGLNFVPNTSQSNNLTSCPTDTSDPKDQTTTTSSQNATPTEVCAVVTNSSKQMLGGQKVTFTVSKGKVGDANVVTDNDTTTYTATSNQQGIAVAYVTASTNGAQTITAAAGNPSVTSNTLTDTYSSQNPVFTVTASPTGKTITAGQTQKFTVSAVDQSGNGVQGEYFIVAQSGPGTINNTTVVTGSDGTAGVNLATQTSDNGSGSVTFTDEGNVNNNNQACNPNTTGSTCNATATYTVSQDRSTKSIDVSPGSIKPVLQTSTVTATAKDASGATIAGVVLNFAGTGANTPSGSATTDSNGVATFSFKPYHKGATTITATDPSDNASGSVTVTIPAGEVTNKLTEASPFSGRVRMFDYPSVGGAGVQVNFYRVVSPTKNQYLGTAKTDANGRAYFQVSGLKSGSTFTGVARSFYNTANFTNRYSNKVTYTVK